MTQKQFQTIRIIIVIALSITIGVAVTEKIEFLPPLAIVIAAGLVKILYRRVKEVTADERDWKVAGQAALMTYRATTIVLVIIASSLLAYSAANPNVYRAGYLLLYIVSFMMVVHVISFLILGKRGEK